MEIVRSVLGINKMVLRIGIACRDHLIITWTKTGILFKFSNFQFGSNVDNSDLMGTWSAIAKSEPESEAESNGAGWMTGTIDIASCKHTISSNTWPGYSAALSGLRRGNVAYGDYDRAWITNHQPACTFVGLYQSVTDVELHIVEVHTTRTVAGAGYHKDIVVWWRNNGDNGVIL